MKKEKTSDMKLIPRSKASEMIGLSPRTLRRKEKPNGPLTPHKISSRCTAYPESELRELIDQSRSIEVIPFESTPEAAVLIARKTLNSLLKKYPQLRNIAVTRA